MNEDLYGLQASGIDPQIASQMLQLKRKRDVAMALQKQAMTPIQQQATPNGGYAIRTSPLEGIAKLVQAYMASRDLDSADKEQGVLATENQKKVADAMSGYERMRMGSPEMAPTTPNDDEGNVNPVVAATKGDPMAAMRSGFSDPLIANSPILKLDAEAAKPRALGRTLVDATGKTLATDSTWAQEQEAARVARQEQGQAAIDAKRADLEMRLADQRTTAQDRMAMQREIAGMRAEGRVAANKPPSGYRQTAEGNLEAIPGGPADTKIQGQFNQDTSALSSMTSSIDRLALEANKLLTHPGLVGITGLRGALPNIPGGDAADAQSLLKTLKSQVGFGVLQDMRNNSKTGGALGNVSDKEGDRLEANLAALDKAQSLKQFKESLGQILTFTKESKGRLSDAFNMKHGDKSQNRRESDKGGAPRVVDW